MGRLMGASPVISERKLIRARYYTALILPSYCPGNYLPTLTEQSSKFRIKYQCLKVFMVILSELVKLKCIQKGRLNHRKIYNVLFTMQMLFKNIFKHKSSFIF